MTDARLHLHALPFSTEGMKILLSLEQLAQERATQVDGLDPLTRSDRESAVEEFLELHKTWERMIAIKSMMISS